jgi:hypothetical protein
LPNYHSVMHMWNTRPNIPLNDGILSTLRASIEVSCEPPGIHVRHLPVLLIPWDVGGGGSKANRLSDGVPPPGRRHHPTNRSVVDGKTKDHCDLGGWKVERGTCGPPDATGPWVPSTRRRPSATDRGWRAEQAVGTPQDIWTARTAHPSAWAVRADPEWLQTLSNRTTVKIY